jgi:hypothetical protein
MLILRHNKNAAGRYQEYIAEGHICGCQIVLVKVCRSIIKLVNTCKTTFPAATSPPHSSCMAVLNFKEYNFIPGAHKRRVARSAHPHMDTCLQTQHNSDELSIVHQVAYTCLWAQQMHTLTQPSMEPEATHLLSGLKCTWVTPALWPLKVWTASFVRRSHSCRWKRAGRGTVQYHSLLWTWLSNGRLFDGQAFLGGWEVCDTAGL